MDLSTALELRNLVERVKACCLISIKEACSYVNIKYVNTQVHECMYIFVLLHDITCHVYMYVMMLHYSFEHFFFSQTTHTSNDFHMVMSVMSQTCKLLASGGTCYPPRRLTRRTVTQLRAAGLVSEAWLEKMFVGVMSFREVPVP